MPTYVITAPDGKEIEVTAPEGATQEQVLAYAQANYKGAASAPAKEAPKPSEPAKPPSVMQQMFGPKSPTSRLFQGLVADPLVGIYQMANNTGLFGDGARNTANRFAKAYNETTGADEFSVPRLAGAILSPVNKLIPAAAGTGVVTKVAQGAAAGAAGGAVAPVSKGENYADEKLFQMGLGAVFGGAVPGAIEGSKALKKFVNSLPITEGNRLQAAYKYLNEMVDPKEKLEVIKALRNAGMQVQGSQATAADALSEAPAGVGLIREQQRVASKTSQAHKFLARDSQNAAARNEALEGAFGTADDLKAALQARTAATAPLREDALAQANVYGQNAPRLEADIASRQSAIVHNLQGQGKAATEEAQALQRAHTWSPIPGLPRFPGRYSPNYERALELKGAVGEFGDGVAQRKAEVAFKKLQLQSITDEGFYPLSSNELLSEIGSKLKTPGSQSNELLANALGSLERKLAQFTDDNGIINSVDLYNVRKEIGDDIKGFLTAKGNPSFGAQAANVEKALKGMLDKAINKAAGTDTWTKYVNEFATHSAKINRMEVGQDLIKKLNLNITDTEKAGTFVNAVNNASGLIKRRTGTDRYGSLDEFLTPQQMATINAVKADLARKAKSSEIAKGVEGAKNDALRGAEAVPGLLSKAVTVTKAILDSIKQGGQKQLDQRVTEMMLDPQKLADFLEAAPKKEVGKLTEIIMSKVSPETRTAFQQVIRTEDISRAIGTGVAQ